MYRVTVKGTKKNATRAAQRYGIALRNCKKLSRGREVACDAPCNKWRAIGKWYMEKTPRGGRPGRGNPPGTLLFYSGCQKPARGWAPRPR
jgi:hypothetical protein